jgi:Leucine-rich repeat (LRR) protein
VSTHFDQIIKLDSLIYVFRTLEKLNISNNKMLTKQAGEALAGALATNSNLKELDVSNSNWTTRGNQWGDDVHVQQGDGAGFAQGFAGGLRANTVLTSLNISTNSIGGYIKYDCSTDWDD